MNKFNFDLENFLENYWEKKPLLIKAAWTKAFELATSTDLLELAADQDFESRMILETGGDYAWQLKHGPFNAEEYYSEGQKTLICHKLNQLHSNFFELQNAVRFLPNWQFDDVMATLSKDGASCGAHIDNYNVFLLQGSGKRKWLLQSNPNPVYQENLDVRLLKEFVPDTEYILEPGDMLYIPPQVAHHGISIGESISYSIGFKALEYANFLDFYTSYLMQSDFLDFYSNPKQRVCNDPIKVDSNDLAAVKEQLIEKVFNTPNFDEALCSFLSRPTDKIEQQMENLDDVIEDFEDGASFCKDVNSQFLYYQGKLFCNGVPFILSENNYGNLRKLILADIDQIFTNKDFPNDLEMTTLLTKLLLNGDLYFLDE